MLHILIGYAVWYTDITGAVGDNSSVAMLPSNPVSSLGVAMLADTLAAEDACGCAAAMLTDVYECRVDPGSGEYLLQITRWRLKVRPRQSPSAWEDPTGRPRTWGANLEGTRDELERTAGATPWAADGCWLDEWSPPEGVRFFYL